MNPERRKFNKTLVVIFTAVVTVGFLMAGCTMGPRPGFAGDGPPQGKGHGGPPPPMDPDRMVAELTRELGLSADQAAQITAIMKAHEEEVRQQMDAGRKQMEEGREAMEALQKKTDDEISQVLTEDQLRLFKELCEKHRHHGPPPGGPDGPGGPRHD